MATTVASLRILLGLDSKDVRDGAGSVKSELKGIQAEAKKTQSTFDEIKRGIGQGLGIGAGLGGFQVASQGVSQFVGFLNDAVKSAQEDEQSVAQLTAAIKANVPAWRSRRSPAVPLKRGATRARAPPRRRASPSTRRRRRSASDCCPW
jgi:hypothetical protein